MSISSDQTQRREEDTCAESERKEGKWEKKRAGHNMAPGPGAKRAGPPAQRLPVGPRAFEHAVPLLFLQGKMGDISGRRGSLASFKRCTLCLGSATSARA